jgi:hypothetical protein
MLSILADDWTRTCSGLTRRELLRVGGLALGGLALPEFLLPRARASSRKVLLGKSVVLLFLQGGPPQIETFDPRPDLPEASRSCTGAVKTELPGISFGGTFPKLAKLAKQIAIVRNFASTDGGHNQLPVLTGRNSLNAPLGAVYARGAGTLNPRTAMPNNVVLVPESVDPELKLGQPTGPFTYGYVLQNYLPGGKLGAPHSAFLPGGGSQLLQNLQLRLSREAFADRRGLLAKLDGLSRGLDRSRALDDLDSTRQKAYEVLLRGVASAFDLKKEDAKTIAKYDTSHCFPMEDYHKGGKLYKNLRNQSRMTNLLGKQLLLARRLCEAGCGVVTVVDSGWDFHADGNNPGVPAGMAALGPQVDHAVAAFIEDVRQRGLSKQILLVVTGEMGRSARKGKNGGTGHNANLTPLLLAGGGLKMGQVVGKSDRGGNAPAGERYTPENLLATLLQTLFDASELRITPEAVPANVAKLITDGKPIREMFN